MQEPEQQQSLEKQSLFNLKIQTPSHPFQVTVQINDKDVVMEIDAGELISVMWPDRNLLTSKTACSSSMFTYIHTHILSKETNTSSLELYSSLLQIVVLMLRNASLFCMTDYFFLLNSMYQ